MDITDFTTYADVRALCGVSEKEIEDTELALGIYSNALELALDSVTLPDEAPGPGILKEVFVTISALDTKTAAQEKLLLLTKMFAAYVVAGQLAKSLPMTAAKAISDSEASLTRFSSEATFKIVMDNVTAGQKMYKQQIEDINLEAVEAPDLLTVVSPETDRVTGE